jgi:hypothetical protein
MPNVINGTSTGSGGLITSGDDSGILNIQTNETTAMSIDASQSVDFTNNIDAPNTFGFKNRIINGAMVIDQRNAGASVTPTDGQFCTDRFSAGLTQASKFSFQQSTDAPTGFKNSIKVTSLSGYSVLAGDLFEVRQNIEGYNIADLGFGTASANTITLSFWVKSSLTGTFGGALSNDGTGRSYPFSYTISTANTWEQKTITVVGETSGTWNSTNGIGMRVRFSLGAGSTYSGTSGAWANVTYTSATGATSVVATNGATWYVTGVQLEKGTQATSFDFRSYGTELNLCYRYFQKYGYGVTTGHSLTNVMEGNVDRFPLPLFQTDMRTTPTVTMKQLNTGTSGQVRQFSSGTTFTVSSSNPAGSSCGGYIELTASATGNPLQVSGEWSAEL